MKFTIVVFIIKNIFKEGGVSVIPHIPDFEDWALQEMEESGMDAIEYCNENGYNISDILKEDDYDED